MKKMVEKTNESLQLIEFILGGNIYGVNIMDVQEVLTKQSYSDIPNTNKNLKGVFNYRGKVIPVINLHSTLGMKDSNDIENTLVLNTGEDQYALDVEDVLGTSTYDKSMVSEVSEELKGKLHDSYTGVVNDGEKLVLLVDFETLLKL